METNKVKEIDLHLTNRCNLSCRTCCYDSNSRILSELNTSQMIDIITQGINLGCDDFHFTGGEPLLREDIVDLTEYVISSGKKLRIQTNGLLLKENLLDRLVGVGLENIMFSLDGSNRILCEQIRGKGSYLPVIKGIEKALNKGLDVRVNMVLTKENFFDYYNMVELCAEMGVKKISSFYFSPIGRGYLNDSLWITPEEYLNFFKIFSEEVGKNKDKLSQIDVMLEKGYATWEEAKNISIDGFSGCGGGCEHVRTNRDYLIVRCDGEVYPCILLVNTNYSLGNLQNLSLNEIVVTSPNWEILNRTKAKNTQCNNCENLDLCGGGCAGYSLIKYNSVDFKDPRCKPGEIVPLCPIMKYNYRNDKLGGSSEDVLQK